MTLVNGTRVDDRKMRELILYLASKSEEDPWFSATKLNKLLFYCDFTAYRELGRSITGHAYQKLTYGPVPKAMLPVLERMKGDGDCVEVERELFGRSQRRVRAERAPETGVFSEHELVLADRILGQLRDHTASEVSELSHDFIGWRVAAPNEVIPYETVFVGEPAAAPLSKEEVEFCRRVEREV
jgi:hypothetical protein